MGPALAEGMSFFKAQQDGLPVHKMYDGKLCARPCFPDKLTPVQFKNPWWAILRAAAALARAGRPLPVAATIPLEHAAVWLPARYLPWRSV